MGMVCFTLNLNAEKIYMQSKVLLTFLTLGNANEEKEGEGKEGLTGLLDESDDPPPSLHLCLFQWCYWTPWLLSLPASRHPVSESASQSRLISSLGTWCVRDFVDWRDVMWGFDAATGELNLCLLGACSPTPTTTISSTACSPSSSQPPPLAVPNPTHWQPARIHW